VGIFDMNTPVDQVLSNSEQSTQVLCGLAAQLLLKNGWVLATAESCTGGHIAAACTDLAGSSTWFERGFVSYSNASKTELLGVDAALIAREGAVSEAVARAMASGAITHSRAQVAVAVTGVAGPSGGSADKPVGTVWLAWATPHGVSAQVVHFTGGRAQVRAATVRHALQGLVHRLGASRPD
jgi:nicotinamide-nucleotide amidase